MKSGPSIITSLLLIFSIFFLSAHGLAESDPSVFPQAQRSKSLNFHLQYGIPYQYVSDTLYSNFNLASLAVSLEKECGLWPFFNNQKLVESLLLEFRFSRIWGKDIELSQDQVSPQVWDQAQKEGRRPRTSWDHSQIGLIPYYRLYYPISKKVRGYAEAGLGITFLDAPLIEDGTQWNFQISGGLGLDYSIKGIPFYTFLRFEHFSNGGKLWREGFTDQRVIGPETIIFGFGFRVPLN
jgi:hypothetical protein